MAGELTTLALLPTINDLFLSVRETMRVRTTDKLGVKYVIYSDKANIEINAS